MTLVAIVIALVIQQGRPSEVWWRLNWSLHRGKYQINSVFGINPNLVGRHEPDHLHCRTCDPAGIATVGRHADGRPLYRDAGASKSGSCST